MAGTSGGAHEIGANAVVLDRPIRRHEARLAVRGRTRAVAAAPLSDALDVVSVAEQVVMQLEYDGRRDAQGRVAVIDRLEDGAVAEHGLVRIRVRPLLAVEELAQVLFGDLNALEAARGTRVARLGDLVELLERVVTRDRCDGKDALALVDLGQSRDDAGREELLQCGVII